MNKREKTLAAAVGALMLALLLYFMASGVSSSFSLRNDQILTLENEIDKKQRTVKLGMRAAKQMQRFEGQSLPGDVNRAQSLYSKWLFDLAGKVQLTDIELNPTLVRSRDNSFRLLQFALSARGNLEEVTRFLHAFYSADHLHRFRSLRIRPIPRSKDLDLSLTIYALSLVRAKADKSLSDQPTGRTAELSTYLDSILNRNLFSPTNQAPQLASISSLQVRNGEPLSFTAQASDRDELDTLTWSLVDNKLSGAEIDTTSGQLHWSPKENGSYQVEIRVADDGFPSQSDTQTVTIVVSDPPPPPRPVVAIAPREPAFDVAKFTVFTTIFEVNGKRRIDLYQRTTGREISFHEGDPLEIGSVLGVIRHIGEKKVEIEVDGERRWLKLGEALSLVRREPTDEKSLGDSRNQP